MNCPNCGAPMTRKTELIEYTWHCTKCEQDYTEVLGELVAIGYTSDF